MSSTPSPGPSDPLPSLAGAFGAQIVEDAYGVAFEFGPFEAVVAERIADGFVAPLPDLGLIRVSGAEAARFLHTQLTNDIEHLDAGHARWNGYCTAKGRMLGSFVNWRDDQAIWLAASRPLVPGLRQRLSMFVLRAKATIEDTSADFLLLGVGGTRAGAALAAQGLPAPDVMATGTARGIVSIGLPPVAVGARPTPRWLLVVPAAESVTLWTALTATLAGVSTAAWRWTDVLAGVPRIVEGTREAFVPQMINFELVGGVDFKKGCYPGQEVVARSQYLGKLKRRTFLGHVDAGALPAPGSDVVGADGAPVGQVAMAAVSPLGGIDLLFECQTAAIDTGVKADGRMITVGVLPYPVPLAG